MLRFACVVWYRVRAWYCARSLIACAWVRVRVGACDALARIRMRVNF